MSRRCVREGCKAWAIKGGTVCNKHGGSAPQVRAKAAVRADLERWRLGDALDNPAETLLRLITQSRQRADLLADRLEQLVAENGGDIHAALVGETLTVTEDGQPIKVGEYVRGLAQQEAAERDRLANFCKTAITAGLAERIVRLEEAKAEQMTAALLAGLDEAGITGELRRRVTASAARHLRLAGS